MGEFTWVFTVGVAIRTQTKFERKPLRSPQAARVNAKNIRKPRTLQNV